MDYGLIKVNLETEFFETINNIIYFTMLGFSTSGSMNTVGYRACSKYGFFPSFFERVIWKEFCQRPHYNNILRMGKNMPDYFCILERGVEGFEFFSPDIFKQNQMYEENKGFYQARYRDITNSVEVEFSPYGEWQIPISINKGKYSFSYFLALPFSKGKYKVHKPHFHAMINSRWPDEKQLDILANSGVQLIRLHNDYREDGPFWHDGCYPPYDRKNMEKLDWVIAQVHKRGMKIVPYFSLKELHPDAPEYKIFSEEWKRTIDKKTVIHNYAGTGEFGAQMCLCSGWSQFRKKSIDLVLKNHDFDGVYYDWVCSQYCNNPNHKNGEEHTDIEELIDLIFWTRKRVGRNGIVFLHLSGVPMMVFENVADLVYTHEDLPWICPYPGDFSPETDFAGITEHQITTSNLCNDPEKEMLFTLSCFLEGLWVCPRTISEKDPVIREMRKFKQYDICSYRFQPAGKKPVVTTEKEVYGSLYWKKNHALIYIANLGNKKIHCRFFVDLTEKGWKTNSAIKIKLPGLTRITSTGKLSTQGEMISLSAWESYFIEIEKYGSVKK